jgi:hypothetical protein
MTQETKFDLESIFENLESIEMINNTKELLDNGIPAYIKDPGMADGVMIKLYPNGTRKIVKIDSFFNERVIG